MTRMHPAVSLAAAALLLTGTIRFASAWFPFTEEPAEIRLLSELKEIAVAAPQNRNIETPLPVEEAIGPRPVAVLAANTGSAAQEAVPANPPAAPAPGEPVRVGNNVLQSRLLRKVEPVYPPLASRARISGNVVLAIKVDEQGFVSDVRVISGHPLLTGAAVDAVKQWQYSPMLLNGQPVPVMATVTIVFALKEDSMVGGRLSPEAGLISPPPPPSHITVRNVKGYLIGFTMVLTNEDGTVVQNPAPFIPPRIENRPEVFDQWIDELKAGWPPDAPKDAIVGYQFYINAGGEVTGLSRIQGPAIPELESELLQLRVYSPGSAEGVASPSFLCILQIRWDGKTPWREAQERQSANPGNMQKQDIGR